AEEDLFSRYERLKRQIETASADMAKFISEVRGIEYLLEQSAIQQKLRTSHELVIFNGTATDFMDWLQQTRSAKQYWDPTSLGTNKFLLPGLVFFLDSSLQKESAHFGQQLKAFDQHAPARKFLTPPILLSTTELWSTDWTDRVKSALDLDGKRLNGDSAS